MRNACSVAFVVLALTVRSSFGVSAEGPWTYVLEDSTSRSSYAYGISPTADGGCVFAGRTFPVGQVDSDLLVVRLDRSGEEIWRVVMPREGYTDEAYDAVELQDGRIAVAGVREEGDGIDSDDSRLLMLDPGGNVIWDDTYPLPGYDLFACVESCPAGGLLVAGELDSDIEAYSNDMRVVALDADGGMLWERALSTKHWEDPGSLLPLADGGCILLGTSGPMDDTESDMWLVRLDPSGRIMLDERYDTGRPDEGIAVCTDGEGGYFLAGTSGYIQSDDLDITVIRVNFEGDEIWNRHYGRFMDDIVTSAVAAPGGCIAVVGRMEAVTGAMLLDPEGSIVWRITIPIDYVEAICALKEGGFAISGNSDAIATVVMLDGEGRGSWDLERSGTPDEYIPDL